MNPRWEIFLFLVFWALPLRAQPGALSRFEHLTVEDGLSQNSVQTIVQDQLGFLWFGTQDGLTRYDGYRFTTYRPDPDDSSSIGGHYIRALAEDDLGRLWIATDMNGLSRFDKNTERFTRYHAGASPPYQICSNELLTVYTDPLGAVWVGTQHDGLCRLDPATGTLTTFEHDPGDPASLSSNSVFTVLRTSKGTLWIGTKAGLSRFETEMQGFTHFYPDNASYQNRSVIHTLYEDQAGRLWIGSQEGLYVWDDDAESIVLPAVQGRAAQELAQALVSGIEELEPNVLWIATSGRGLFVLDVEHGTVVQYRQVPTLPHSLSNNDLLAIQQDRSGVLWLGTGGSGVDRLAPGTRHFTAYQPSAGVAHAPAGEIVRSFAETEPGVIWVGHGEGVDRLETQTERFTHLLPDPGDTNSLGGRYVRAVAAGASGTLWIGMNGAGLDHYDPSAKTFTHYDAASGLLTSNEIRALLTGADGDLWVGTAEGLARMRPATRTSTHHRHDPGQAGSLSHDHVTSLYRDRSGVLWVGTRGGLNRLDAATNTFIRYLHAPKDQHSLSQNFVTSVYESRDGAFWVTTYGGGLNRLDRATGYFTHITEKQGLPNNIVYGILEDDDGRLWLSTNSGLARYDPRTETITSYSTRDGLPFNEFNTGAYFKSRDGRMYFGGIGGFVAFYPDEVAAPASVGPVVLTGLEVFGREKALPQPLHTTDKLVLERDENFFSLHFALPDYAAPERNRFAYRLEGYDEDWVEAGERPLAIYTGVPPGEYVFWVRGAGRGGLWSDPTSLPLRIRPAFYETWWLKGLVLALVLALMVGAYRYRVHTLLELERTRRRIAYDLHDDIGAKMSSIALMVDVASRNPSLREDERNRLAETAHGARQVVDDLRDSVWLIDSGRDRLTDLIQRLEKTAHVMLQDIDHRIKLPAAVPEVMLEMEMRRHILMIFKEALHNALRHSAAARIDVEIDVEADRLHVQVTDDGCGFDETHVEAGHGLVSMRTRIREVNGSLLIDSRLKRGTTVRMRVKIV